MVCPAGIVPPIFVDKFSESSDNNGVTSVSVVRPFRLSLLECRQSERQGSPRLTRAASQLFRLFAVTMFFGEGKGATMDRKRVLAVVAANIIGLSAFLGLAPWAAAAVFYWDGDPSTPGLQAGDGYWLDSSINWATDANGDGDTTWVDGSDANFYASGESTVTLSDTVNVGNITFAGSGCALIGYSFTPLNFTGGTITATQTTALGAVISVPITVNSGITLTKAGSGVVTLLGNSIAYADSVAVSAGTLQVQDTCSSSGTAGPFTGFSVGSTTAANTINIASGATLELTVTLANSAFKNGADNPDDVLRRHGRDLSHRQRHAPDRRRRGPEFGRSKQHRRQGPFRHDRRHDQH